MKDRIMAIKGRFIEKDNVQRRDGVIKNIEKVDKD